MWTILVFVLGNVSESFKCKRHTPFSGMFWIIMSVVALVVDAAVGLEARAQVPCEEARLKCAYREGCGMALQNYMVGCSAVLQGPTQHCPQICLHSLIALTSTEEGRDLMNCQCNDEFCEEQKSRVEICRPSVTHANRNGSVVSCTAAQWICAADTLCSTALEYYHRNCKSMFNGKKCTHRCQNSINILRRQEKAAKLKTCKCSGHEDYDCPVIQANMARLCFHKKVAQVDVTVGNTETNVIQHQLEIEPPTTGGGSGGYCDLSHVHHMLVGLICVAILHRRVTWRTGHTDFLQLPPTFNNSTSKYRVHRQDKL